MEEIKVYYWKCGECGIVSRVLDWKLNPDTDGATCPECETDNYLKGDDFK